MQGTATSVDCRLCGSADYKTEFQTPRFDLLICKKCGHFYSQIKATTEKYQDDYFSAQHKDYFEKPDIGFFNQIHNLVQNHFRSSAKLSLLDVGTGFGTLPRHFANLGYESFGIDISKDAIDYGTNHLKISGLTAVAIENYHPGRTFDVITLSNVIEHIPDPISFLKEVNRLLAPNGILVCDTVDSDSLIFFLSKMLYKISGGRLYKSIERVCEVHHLHHFNQTSLALALEKSGFKITNRFYRNLQLGTISLTPLQKIIVACMYGVSNVIRSFFLQGVICVKA